MLLWSELYINKEFEVWSAHLFKNNIKEADTQKDFNKNIVEIKFKYKNFVNKNRNGHRIK